MTEALALTPVSGGAAFRRIAGLGLAAALVVLFVFHETALELAQIWWRSETFAHGLVVVPISCWLIWNKRQRLAGEVLRPSFMALIPLGLGGFGWLIGSAASVAALEHFSLIAMLISALWAVWGNSIARLLAFPLGFLFFGVPFGEFLIPVMMKYTADFTVAALRLSGIPVYREGLQFVIPSGSWSVVEACSGIRYLIASTMVGVLFAYLNYRSLLRRALFVLAALLVPLVANWLRAYLIVMLGHLSGNRIATGVDHLIYGWLFFGIVILALFWVGSWWREEGEEMRPGGEVRANVSGTGPARVWIMLAAVLALGALCHPALAWLMDVPGDSSRRIEAPRPAPGWSREDAFAVAGFLPHYVGDRSRSLATYRSGARAVSLLIVHYAHQSPGHELVQWDNRLLFREDKFWSEIEAGRDAIVPAIAARRSLLRGATGKSLAVWSWYWLDGRQTADEFSAKLALAADRLARRRDDSDALVVWTETGENPEEARAAVQAFLAAHKDAIRVSLLGDPPRR
ncbi:exosortase A [Niveibacterium terrae]|uniref:exosortase A n=1 Tax=Niveibacterium terrae TaxID=3373598 RepID=UPI003A8FF357